MPKCYGAQGPGLDDPICEGPDVRLVRYCLFGETEWHETHWCSDCRAIAVYEQGTAISFPKRGEVRV
jgi:hypothetical protein